MSTDVNAQTRETVLSGVRRNPKKLYLLDTVIVLVMGVLLFCGASWQMFNPHTDATSYQCYASAFLYGLPSLTSYPHAQCQFIHHTDGQTLTNARIASALRASGAPATLVKFVAKQDISSSFHMLPHEYPLLTLIPFLLVMFSPQVWYQVAFALLMIVLAASMYVVLVRVKSRKVALFGAVLLVLGGWGTVAGRFDLVPSLLTLGVLIVAKRKRWNWAFALLALAFLIKFYPVALLLPLLLAQQMDVHEKWFAWRRWRPLIVFLLVCMVVMGISLFLNVEGTIAPFSYFQTRPIQVESFGSSLIWLSTFVSSQAMTFEFRYGSLNVLYAYSTQVSFVETVLLMTGLACTFWLQWRKKIDLALSTLLTLLIVMVTGKIFSPQYLIWVVPLLAYVGGEELTWFLAWVPICALTTFIYPFIYNMSDILKVPHVPWFYPAATLRNVILFGFIVAVLVFSIRKRAVQLSEELSHPATHDEEKA